MKLLKCFGLAAGAAVSFFAGLHAQTPAKADPSTVVAIVDGKNVTLRDFEQILSVAPPNLAQQIRIDPQTGLLAWFSTLHLAKEAEQMKLDQKSPWKEQLEAVRAQYLTDARVNEEVNGYNVTSAMVRKWYEDHQKDYQRVFVRGVLIRYRPEMKVGATSTKDLEAQLIAEMGNNATRSESEARDLARKIALRIEAGEDLKKLVAEFSEDLVTKEREGEIGWVTATSAHDPGFRKAVMLLGKGEVSGAIPLPGGFYVLRAEDRGVSPLNDVSAEINQEIRKVHLNEFITGVRNRFSPDIVNPNALAPYRIQSQQK